MKPHASVSTPKGDLYVNWRHIDGPLMYLSDGQFHWLTWRERIQLFFGWTTLEYINIHRQNCPSL